MSNPVLKRLSKNEHPTQKLQHRGGVSNVPLHQAEMSVSHMSIDQYSPQSGANQIMQYQQSIVDFIYYGGTVSGVRGMFVEIPITNASTTDALSLVNPLFFCYSNPIQLSLDGNEFQLFFSEGQLYSFNTMNDEETKMWCSLMGNIFPETLATTSLTSATGTFAANEQYSIPAGESRTYYLPLFNDAFSVGKIPLNSLKSTVRVRLQFDPFGNVTTSNNAMTNPANLLVGNIQLYICGSAMGPSQNTSLIVPSLAEPISATYYKRERQIIGLGTYTPTGTGAAAAGQIVNQTLSSLSGFYSSITNFLRESGAVREKAYQYYYAPSGSTGSYTPENFVITQSTLYDANRKPVETVALPSAVKRYAEALMYIEGNNGLGVSTFNTKYPYSIWQLGGSTFESVRNGVVGGYVVNNSWAVQLQGPRIAIPGSPALELVILSDRLFEMHIDVDGRATAVPVTY